MQSSLSSMQSSLSSMQSSLRLLKEKKAAKQLTAVNIPVRRIRNQLTISPPAYGSFDTIMKYLSNAGPAANAMLAERDEHGNTILMVAIANADLQTVKYLVEEKNAPIDAKNNLGVTALMIACMQGRGDVLDVLLPRMTSEDINVASAEDGITALMFACDEGTLDNVKKLVKAGADVNKEQTAEGGGRAINMTDKPDIIRYLQTVIGPRGGRRTHLKKRNTSARRASSTRRRRRRRI